MNMFANRLFRSVFLIVCIQFTPIEAQGQVQGEGKRCENGEWNSATLSCDCYFNFFGNRCNKYPRDCTEAFLANYTGQGQLMVKPNKKGPVFPVWCEFDWGGWTFLERRGDNYLENVTDPNLSFDRTWIEFKAGFGEITSEHFLGMDNIREIIGDGQTTYQLSVGIGFNQAYYHDFWIDNDANNYKLHYSSYEPWFITPLADGFGQSALNGSAFCTKDNDCGLCATSTNSGWWLGGNCTAANLHLPETGISMGSWPDYSNPGNTIDITSEYGLYMMAKRNV